MAGKEQDWWMMRINRYGSSKAQSIMEYAIIVGAIAVALSAMQLYFRRGIQTVVKVASDEIGDQRYGGVDVDYDLEWKIKGESQITTQSVGNKVTTTSSEGAVNYEMFDQTTKEGVASHGFYVQD